MEIYIETVYKEATEEVHMTSLNKCKIVRYINFINAEIKKRVKKKKLYGKMQILYNKNGKIEVLRGPFQGMVYPDFISTGSVLYPKLSGIYEKEIQPIFDTAKLKKYKYIYDIGCAEGYYAIGLKRVIPEAEVYAFDIDEHAQKLCANMAKANHVKIHIEGECSAKRLKTIDFSGERPSFIISDCEGAERKLFTGEVIGNLQNCECLIEVHDWLQYDTPTLDKLIRNFEKSHNYRLVYGVDDYEKVYRYQVKEFESLTIEEKFMMMAEHRKRLGQWIYFTPKN